MCKLDLIIQSQLFSGNLASYSISSGPSQYTPQPAHLRHRYPLFLSSFLRHQHSDAYVTTRMTNVPYSFTLVAVVILFDLQILLTVLNIAKARPILHFM